MNPLIRFLRGSITIRITGVEPEQMLNLCCKHGIDFYKIQKIDAFHFLIEIPTGYFAKVKALESKAQCEIQTEKKSGLPFFLLRFRKRHALLLGLFLFLLSICIFSRFIFVIDIVGNESVSNAAILSELRRQGVTIGVYGPNIPRRELSHHMLLAMDELSFFSLNLHGVRAEVIVRERTPTPKIVKENLPTDVRAAATGIIQHMEVRTGEAMFKEGDTVIEGDILIAGEMDIKEPEYGTMDLGTVLTHAQGRVIARTFRTITAKIPLSTAIKQPSNQEFYRLSLDFFGRRINFFGKSRISDPMYDKITKTKTWSLPDGTTIPFRFQLETMRPYHISYQEIDLSTAEILLKDQLLQTLKERLDAGEVIDSKFLTQRDQNFLFVTLTAECIEQIGRTVAIQIPNSEELS
ncbi:MAG: sporulation protein YqfD [Evtepia sp.]